MRFFILFITIPILEIVLFIKITEQIGLFWTIVVIISTAIIGSFAVKNQGLNVLFSLRKPEPDTAFLISNGVLILVAGLLLITPGLITDAVGFILLVPRFRGLIIKQIRKKISSAYRGHDIYDL
ncbi:MAG: FxsA family protein [Pseudomonadota bacterium]|nr:FxsA family protein [Pseudomonadota bacterium]